MRRMFSKKQIERLVAENPAAVLEALKGQDISVNGITSKGIANTGNIANIGDIATTGDITAKTLMQSEANQTFNITFPEIANFEKLSEYCALKQVNRRLSIIGLARYRNTSEASQNFKLGEWTISSIPESIGSLIFDASGQDITKALPSGSLAGIVRLFPLGIEIFGSSFNIQCCELKHTGENTLAIWHGSQSSVSANGVVAVSFEINIAL